MLCNRQYLNIIMKAPKLFVLSLCSIWKIKESEYKTNILINLSFLKLSLCFHKWDTFYLAKHITTFEFIFLIWFRNIYLKDSGRTFIIKYDLDCWRNANSQVHYRSVYTKSYIWMILNNIKSQSTHLHVTVCYRLQLPCIFPRGQFKTDESKLLAWLTLYTGQSSIDHHFHFPCIIFNSIVNERIPLSFLKSKLTVIF